MMPARPFADITHSFTRLPETCSLNNFGQIGYSMFVQNPYFPTFFISFLCYIGKIKNRLFELIMGNRKNKIDIIPGIWLKFFAVGIRKISCFIR